MGTFGHIIKFERIRQNIKQVQLSDGICTPSYLSKIESNSIVPSEDVLNELFKRLNIEPSKSILLEEDYLEHIRSLYKVAITFKNKEKISEYLQDLSRTHYLFSEPSNFYTYILILIRMKFMVGHEIQGNNIPEILTISKFADDFNAYQSFLYHSCLGYMHYFKNEFSNSLHSLEKANLYHVKIKVDEFETADFNYFFGVMNLHHNKLVISLDLISKAQLFFNKELLLYRAVESYITSAVSYKRASNYEKYFEQLKLAEKLAIDENMDKNLSLIYLNMSAYYSIKENVKYAINYNQKVLNLTSDYWVILKTLYSLVLQYSIINNYNEVIKLCNEGLALYRANSNELTREFYFHFQIHLSIHSNHQDFEKIIKEALQYFYETNDFRHAHKYSILIANFYLDYRKYKKATHYFALANEYLARKENRRFIEEI